MIVYRSPATLSRPINPPTRSVPLLIQLDTPPWMADALCTQTDPEAFFPEKGASNRAAKAVCAACPVAAPCLDYALEHQEAYGIWGGVSERDRRKLRLLTAAADTTRETHAS